MQGEGCQLTGSLQISRVPGNFRISAKSDSHSFNTRVMNVRHATPRHTHAATHRGTRGPAPCPHPSTTQAPHRGAALTPQVSHHVDKLVFGAINEAGRLKHVMPIEERSSLFSTSFMMHQARGPTP